MIDTEAHIDEYGWVYSYIMPYPDTETMEALSPHTNGRSNYKKVKVTKRLRAEAKQITEEVIGDIRWDRCVVMYRFYKKDRGTLDESNMIQRCKSLIDGIVDSGIVPSDCNKHMTVGPVHSGVDKINPRIEIVLQRLQVW